MFLSRALPCAALLGLLSTTGAFAQNATNTTTPASNHTTVLILGGGMAGIIAARTLYEQGVDDFILLDGKIELGGRMIGKAFGVTGRQVVVEYGPSWVRGTQEGNGAANPIWELALKYNLTTVQSDFGSLSMSTALHYGSVQCADEPQLPMTRAGTTITLTRLTTPSIVGWKARLPQVCVVLGHVGRDLTVVNQVSGYRQAKLT